MCVPPFFACSGDDLNLSYSLAGVNRKCEKIKQFVLTENMQVCDGDVKTAVIKLMKFKECVGNIGMDIHYLTAHLAKDFLQKKHRVTINIDKPSGSAGLDIESDNIVAEIKTTIPYQPHDFGATQKREITKDLERLSISDAPNKYFFIIDDNTERILKSKYMTQYPTVKVVNLLREV
jgi:hypothetical protein